jgi:hypothetical protein
MKKNIIFFFLSFTVFIGFTQNNQSYNTLSLSPEFFIGQTFQPNSWFPKLKTHYMFGVGLESKNYKFINKWSNTINLSTTGIAAFYSSIGNNKVVGNAISLLPFVEINLNKQETFSTKFGLGASYFTEKYHPENNALNTAVSTDFTWAFLTAIYYNFQLKNKRLLKIGVGYFHHSNGHTQLPNSGLNTALVSISTNFELKRKYVNIASTINLATDIKNYTKFYEVRYGQGIQKFINHKSSVKAINSFEIKGGLFYKDILKFSTGITYSFYQHYYDYIKEFEVAPYFENPFINASNVYVSVGVEALFGTIGIDWEGGINVYKPFYKEHYKLEEETLDNIYNLKNRFLGRLGLKLYAINTLKKPKSNFYIGTHIKSNLSQADYTELSIGFVHRIMK